jgi:hypothetical protein
MTYQQQVKEFRAYQAKYEEGVKKNLDEIQQLELRRIAKVREILQEFVKSQEQLINAYKSAIEDLKKEIAKINEKEDTDNFIKNNKTNKVPEEPVQYEPYASQVSNLIFFLFSFPFVSFFLFLSHSFIHSFRNSFVLYLLYCKIVFIFLFRSIVKVI